MSASRYSVDNPLRVAIAGYGNVGRTLAPRLTAGEIPGVKLTAICDVDLDKTRAETAHLDPRPLVASLTELPDHADVIIEAATFESFAEIARPALAAGKTLLAVSVGALGVNLDLIEFAEKHGGRIQVCNGALPGLDIIRCAKEGGINSVKLTSRIRPDSLVHEEYILAQGWDFSTPPAEPLKVFEGTAREASAAFPRHFNVAVALSVAGIGLDRTMIEVWADEGIPGAIHRVEVDSEVIQLDLISKNRPSPTNNATSRIVAPSIMAALRSMVSPIRLGS
jgi:aspartate dehydrogenase